MARVKKAARVLTPEEKLQQALVPVEKQPYSIPENWCWIKLQFVCEYLKAGGDKPVSFVKEKDKDHLFPVVANGIENDGIIGFTDVGQIPAGTVSVSGRGTIGYSIFRDYEYMPVVRLIVIKPQGNLLPHYLKFAFDVFEEKGIGSSIPQLTVPMIKDKFIPLPPLAEQNRIVTRIESLFAKLDEAKEKAQAVVDGFELRKSAILHKAFMGELTKRWRKVHRVGLDSWESFTVGGVCNDIKVGIVIKPSQYYTNKDNGTPAFRSANVRECRVDDFDWVYLNEEGMANNKRSIVHTGDVLIVRSGNPGTACVVSDIFDSYNAIDILIAVPNQELILPDFLCLFTNSPLGKKSVAENKRGMALAHFNVKGYSKVQLYVPLISEQREIIHVLNKFMEKEQQAKDAAEAVLAQIDTMKKAILARAFRGELGTNDPEEEWAGELLKTILEE